MVRWALFLAVSFSASAQPDSVFSEWKNDPALKGAILSACVTDVSSGNIMYQLNKDLSMVPASTLKFFTTTSALAILGAGHTYSTALAHTGTFDPETGVISGDLLIIGGGDPSLQSEYFATDVIAEWTNKLSSLGLKEITGDIIGWSGLWPRTIPDHWIWADISNYFGAIPAGLSFRDNKFSIEFTSGGAGSIAAVSDIYPKYREKKFVLTASVTCLGNQDQAFVYGDPFGYQRTISGTIPQQKGKFTIEASLPDPALLCAEELFVSLAKAGVRCRGKAASSYSPLPDDFQKLHTHLSPPLSVLIRHTNQRSDNLYCESMYMTLGKGNRDSAAHVVKRYWQSAGLDSELLFMADGSGLSRASSCTARLLCQALNHVSGIPHLYTTIDSSLPRAGRDASMRSIGNGTFMENNLRAKTGYMERVRAYCGFVKSRSGRDISFSVIFNNYNCAPGTARRKIERLMAAITEL